MIDPLELVASSGWRCCESRPPKSRA